MIAGCAKDIVEHAGVARFWFSNFPLGHSAGKPFDRDSQSATINGALTLLDSAREPRTTEVSPQRWADDDAWEQDFWSLEGLSEADIARLQQAHEQVRATAAEIKRSD